MIDSVKCFGKIKEHSTGIASVINCFLNFVNYKRGMNSGVIITAIILVAFVNSLANFCLVNAIVT